jgi:hypothetical protein
VRDGNRRESAPHCQETSVRLTRDADALHVTNEKGRLRVAAGLTVLKRT